MLAGVAGFFLLPNFFSNFFNSGISGLFFFFSKNYQSPITIHCGLLGD